MGAMKYTQLGRTGLKVSRLVLGTMNFGPQTNESDSHAIMDSALGAGLNFFDTANVYGWGENKGRTEEILGTWFAQGGGRRDKVVLATKMYGNMSADGEAWPNHDKLSAVNIRRAVDASLKRLQTDHIDLYQFHHVDRNTPFDEIWQAIDVLVQQGKILYAGSSNFSGYKIAQANEQAARRGSLGLVSEQCIYNLVERRAEMEVIPAAQEYGLGVIPWSPLHGGLLGGVIKKTTEGGRRASGRAADALADPRDPCAAPGVRGPPRQARPGARRGGPGLAADPPRHHGPDRRPAHRRAAGQRAAGTGAGPPGGGPHRPGRDLPGPGPFAGGVRLVGPRGR
ncbi:Predicted oxidoreductase [Streptomyces sp. Termitarium-T10T-6]|nr:Predicted oxidoreductase [Streptomyces sp. Termitarium-T10T-6]